MIQQRISHLLRIMQNHYHIPQQRLVNDCFSVYKNSVKLAKGSYTVDVKDSGDNLIIKSFSYTQTSPDGYTYVVKTPVGLTIYAPNVSE